MDTVTPTSTPQTAQAPKWMVTTIIILGAFLLLTWIYGGFSYKKVVDENTRLTADTQQLRQELSKKTDYESTRTPVIIGGKFTGAYKTVTRRKSLTIDTTTADTTSKTSTSSLHTEEIKKGGRHIAFGRSVAGSLAGTAGLDLLPTPLGTIGLEGVWAHDDLFGLVQLSF